MPEQPRFAFFTSHALVLLAIDRRPDGTVRELAEVVGVTERQVHRVIEDLEADGYVTRARVGRQNHYVVNRGLEEHDRSIAAEIRQLPRRGSLRPSRWSTER